MEELKRQLDELNRLATELYNHVERSSMKLTRRRLLILEILLFVDANVNAVFRLLAEEPRYVDSAEMILRSIYDLISNGDWILKSKDNSRLWRWLRDDRKTLHQQLKGLVNLMTANPKLITKEYPLKIWQDRLDEVEDELTDNSRRAGVSNQASPLSLFSKAQSMGQKAQRTYHTVFWIFSNKTHASPTGLINLVTLHPLKLRRRDTPLPQDEEAHAVMLLKTALLWYSAHVYHVAKYFGAPQVTEAKRLRDKHLGR